MRYHLLTVRWPMTPEFDVRERLEAALAQYTMANDPFIAVCEIAVRPNTLRLIQHKETGKVHWILGRPEEWQGFIITTPDDIGWREMNSLCIILPFGDFILDDACRYKYDGEVSDSYYEDISMESVH